MAKRPQKEVAVEKDVSPAAEYQVETVHDRIDESRGSRLALFTRELGWLGARRASPRQLKDSPERFIILPDNRAYRLWKHVILIWAVYSCFFTPLEFGFFRGLPRRLLLLDVAGQLAFLVDIVLHFFVAYRDKQTYRIVTSPTRIALRYLKPSLLRESFAPDLFACLPWDILYKVFGRREAIRCLLWIRLVRLWKIEAFFNRLEKNIRVKYMLTRILKLIVVELYCTHTAACIFYYLATTVPPNNEGQTWIGNLQLGEFSYVNFREIDIGRRYVTSLYFAIITMTTVGYGDIHAVNIREMIFIMIFVSFDMILGAYLIGNMTALIVKGSNTERFRDKMTDLTKYMNRNRLGKGIRDQIEGHVRLQYESSYTDSSVLHDIPASIRSKISETLYKPYIEEVTLFRGCSSEFINQIATRLQEEFFLPGEVILEQGNAVDQLYFVCHGDLDGVQIGEDGSEETVMKLQPSSSFGDIAILCNIPQPYTIRVRELSQLLRLDKQSFTNILQIYFYDGRTILTNLLESSESQVRIKQLESDIIFHIAKQEAELALKVNSAAYNGDLRHLKGLIRAGADPNKTDYDRRSPLHIAALKGYEDITLFLIQEGADINKEDNFGNTPFLEAIKSGHDKVASLLVKQGASLSIDDAGCHLCTAVARGDSDFLKRVLSYGIDPNVRNYDDRTPLHIAAAEGLYLMARILLESGASVLQEDRWGRTPLDEARKCGSRPLLKLLEKAKPSELSEFSPSSLEIQDRIHRRKCTVFPFLPWEKHRREGVVLWIPHTMEDLIKASEEHLKCSVSHILSEDGGKVLDIHMISDGQKLYSSVNSVEMRN